MNVRLERGAPLPELPSIPAVEKPAPVDVVIDRRRVAEAGTPEILLADQRKAAEVRVAIDQEPIGEEKVELYYRELESILSFTEKVKVMQLEAEDGMYRQAWDVIAAFEVEKRTASDDLPAARRHFFAFVDRLKEIEKEGEEQKVFAAITKKFFVDADYRVNKNSLVEALADHGEMNCDSRFKGTAASLEALGYNPDSQIFVVEYADHLRTIVRTKDGYTALDGDSPERYVVSEDGTAVMPLTDYKRTLLGLLPEHRQVFGEQHNLHKNNPGFVKKALDRWFPSPEHAVSSPNTGGGQLKAKDSLNLSRFAHLIPSSVLSVLRSQLFADVHSAVGGVAKHGKAVAGWRSTKLAVGGSVAMAMYSACGPMIEKYSSAQSPDEAADLIHEDLAELKTAFEEQVDQVANAVEKVFELNEKVEKLEEKKTEAKSAGTAKGQTWGDFAEQMPLSHVKMTKEEVYFMLAEQDLTYGVVDFALEHSGEDVSKLTIDVGNARVLDPSFWKHIIDKGVAEVERQQLGKDGLVITLDIRGQALNTTASYAALDEAWEQLTPGGRGLWMGVRFAAKVNGKHFLVPNYDELVAPGPKRYANYGTYSDDRGDRDMASDWRAVLGAVGDEVVMARAKELAVAMGEPDVTFDISHDRARSEHKQSYDWELAKDFRQVPIGFIDFGDEKTNRQPIFSEEEKNTMLASGDRTFQPISDAQRISIEQHLQRGNFAQQFEEAILSGRAATIVLPPPPVVGR